MSASSLEQRLQRLEDQEAIRTLMSKYADYTNKGWNGKVVEPEKMPEIFSTDATWNSPDMGLSGVGVDVIAAGIRTETAVIDFSMHAYLNPIVDVNGDSATGRWLMWIAVMRGEGPRLVFLSQDLTYVRTTEGWRIQSLLLHVGSAMGALPLVQH